MNKVQCIDGQYEVEIFWKKGLGFLHGNYIMPLKRTKALRKCSQMIKESQKNIMISSNILPTMVWKIKKQVETK